MDISGPNKGKSPVNPRDNGKSTDAKVPSSKEEDSLPSRVLSSASGLAKDLLAPGAHITSQLSQVSGSSKGSSSQVQQRGESSHLNEPSLGFGSASSHAGVSQLENFRSGQQESKWSDEEFDKFFVGEQPVFDPTSAVGASSSNANWATEFQNTSTASHSVPAERHGEIRDNDFLNDIGRNNIDLKAFQEGHLHSPGYDHDQYDDGAEVRDLLNDPDFVAVADVYDFEDSAPPPASLFSQDFSEHEKQAVSKIRADLPPPPTYNVSRSERSELTLFQPNFEDEEGKALFATPEERSQFLSQWTKTIDSYVDEVWGQDLLPVVREVREELEKAKTTGSGSLNTKALARLKMVLGHISEQHTFQYMDFQTNLTNVQTSLRMQNYFYVEHQQTTIQVLPQIQAQQFSNVNDQDHKHNFHEINNIHYQKALNSENSQDKEYEDDDLIEFHCPWIACHESFRSMRELRRHSMTHEPTTRYPCPHASCVESLTSRSEWAKHIKVAHHDLLDASVTAVIIDENIPQK